MTGPCNAALVIWLETTNKGERVYHSTVRPLQQRTGTLDALSVPEGSNRGRYFAGIALVMLGEDKKTPAQLTPRSESPQRYAAEMGNLANVYAERPTGNRDANLRTAIRIYKQVLEIFTRQDFPADWALTQNNLGNAYADLPTGDREQNLPKAIGCYQAALSVRTRDDFPVDWALTQNNLGNAYADLLAGDRGHNLQNAIDCYEAALTVLTRDDFPHHHAITIQNLQRAREMLDNLS
ncbi:MAG: tetratricopeptide repeat protein [Acidobacteria bacterium]|nr:tetratricopeptide repeat protein [Acidobacteriota bacterium]